MVWKTWVGVVAAFALAAAAHASVGHTGKYQIGLQLYTVRDECEKDFPGTLKAVGEMGFDGVEFAGYYGRTALELRRMLEQDHLQCYGTHISLDSLLGDEFDKTVAFNKELGNRLLVVPSIPEERRNSRAAWIATAKLFSDIAKKLARHGMILAYHNHMVEFKPIDGEMPWYTFFEHADRKVAIEFDTGNALAAGQQAAPFLSRFPGRVIAVHVKDFSAGNPEALLGEGDEHWHDVIPLIKGKTGTRWYIIEQESYPFPSLVCAEKCLHTFEKMME